MATTIKKLEKDFYFKVIYDEQIPLMYIKGKTQYILTIERNMTKGQLFLKADRPIDKLKVNKSINLIADYHGQVIMFPVQVASIIGEHIIAPEPESLYKDLDRSFSRVTTPENLHVQFAFLEDRYSLPYPRVPEYEAENLTDFFQNMDPTNLKGIIEQIGAWVKGFASGQKIVIFKGGGEGEIKTAEERLLAETGKTFFLPSTKGSLPSEDPYPKKRLITEHSYKLQMSNIGINWHTLIERKQKAGIISDLWVPILFQEYMIGYIRVWIDNEKMMPLDYDIIDNLYQFAKALTYSLQTNGFFEAGKIKNEPFEAKIIDISASGLLFTYPLPTFFSSLRPDTELAVQLKTAKRILNIKIKVVRRYREESLGYYGCRFIEMAPEDLRFLFDYIYGRKLTDEDVVSFIK